jgi:hypothetical protein
MGLKQAKSNRKNGFKTGKSLLNVRLLPLPSICIAGYVQLLIVPAILKMRIFFLAIAFVQRISSM